MDNGSSACRRGASQADGSMSLCPSPSSVRTKHRTYWSGPPPDPRAMPAGPVADLTMVRRVVRKEEGHGQRVLVPSAWPAPRRHVDDPLSLALSVPPSQA